MELREVDFAADKINSSVGQQSDIFLEQKERSKVMFLPTAKSVESALANLVGGGPANWTLQEIRDFRRHEFPQSCSEKQSNKVLPCRVQAKLLGSVVFELSQHL